MMANGKMTARIIGVSMLNIVNATTVRKNCKIVIRRLNVRLISAVSMSRENLFNILPMGVVSVSKYGDNMNDNNKIYKSYRRKSSVL